MESKGKMGGALAKLLSLQSSNQFRVFCVSPSPPCAIARGVLYIVGFGQDEVVGSKVALKGCVRGAPP
jgi:hypothetical protein